MEFYTASTDLLPFFIVEIQFLNSKSPDAPLSAPPVMSASAVMLSASVFTTTYRMQFDAKSHFATGC